MTEGMQKLLTIIFALTAAYDDEELEERENEEAKEWAE